MAITYSNSSSFGNTCCLPKQKWRRGCGLDPNAKEFMPRTTIMIRNIPNKYNFAMFLSILDGLCAALNKYYCHYTDNTPIAAYDFVYLPVDFQNRCNLGYAFVNFTDCRASWKAYEALNGHTWSGFKTKKICEVTFARIQGARALKEHFEKSIFKCDKWTYLPAMFNPARDGMLLTRPYFIGCPTNLIRLPRNLPPRISNSMPFPKSQSKCKVWKKKV